MDLKVKFAPLSPQNVSIAKEIDEGSDRVCAILGLSYLEEKLTTAIKLQLVQDKTSLTRMFKPSGPLGPFSMKATIGYLLGLYKAPIRDDMYILAEIRNAFAHWPKVIDFASRDIRLNCEKLDGFRGILEFDDTFFPRPFSQQSARNKYVWTIASTASFLEMAYREPREIPEPFV